MWWRRWDTDSIQLKKKSSVIIWNTKWTAVIPSLMIILVRLIFIGGIHGNYLVSTTNIADYFWWSSDDYYNYAKLFLVIKSTLSR